MRATDKISTYLLLETKAETKYRSSGQEETPIKPQKEKQSAGSLTAGMKKLQHQKTNFSSRSSVDEPKFLREIRISKPFQ